MVVTVVNVFGSWLGDFVAPGQHKETKTENVATNDSHVGGTNNSNTAQNTSSNNTTTGNSTTTTVAAGTVNANTTGVHTTPTQQITAMVAGVSTNNPVVKVASNFLNKEDLTKDSKKIRLNLAWLLVILPFIYLATRMTKYILIRRASAQK
jgi:hypothetical protein